MSLFHGDGSSVGELILNPGLDLSFLCLGQFILLSLNLKEGSFVSLDSGLDLIEIECTIVVGVNSLEDFLHLLPVRLGDLDSVLLGESSDSSLSFFHGDGSSVGELVLNPGL